MIKRNIFKQEAPAVVWEIPMMEPNATMGRALAAYDSAGNSLTWDSWEFTNGKLMVNFGIDPTAGSLSYEYQLPNAAHSEGSPLVSITTNYGEIKVSPEALGI